VPFELISPALLRAPLLPVRALAGATRALRRHPLGATAVELASPDLGAALAGGGARAEAAFGRYARRAAFRPTPAGLLAGVTTAALGSDTHVHTDGARAEVCLEPAWGRLAALGRALLDDPAVREHARLRAAPSLLRGPEEVTWLALDADGDLAGDGAGGAGAGAGHPDGPGGGTGDRGGGLDQRWAVVDPPLAAVLAAAAEAAPWPEVRRALARALGLARGGDHDDDLDQHLLLLVDQGLLVHDLCPPLVGEPPAAWLDRRLAALPPALVDVVAPLRRGLAAARGVIAQAAGAAAVARARAALAGLPGAARAPGASLAPVLRLGARGPARLDRRAVARAAEVAPLLFRLQQALAAPVEERALAAPLAEQLFAFAERFGAGAFALPALATGGFGARPDAAGEGEPPPSPAPPGLVAWLAGALADTAAAGAAELALDAAALEALLPPAPAPATFELVLAPAREPARAPRGTGWLLGLHGPAGASLGRFAAAVGNAALAALAAREAEARPGEQALDVAFAASAALAHLSVHPAARAATLALVGFCEGPRVEPAQLQLVIDGAAAEPLGLRAPGGAVAPRPLHRVRSTTAPPGVFSLLAGWTFLRQHTPWAFQWGPFAALPYLPRVVLDGFVVAPASWRLPPPGAWRTAAAFARWRREVRMPPAVQVVQPGGQGDELLYIDLTARDARRELDRFAGGRAFEIWPPLDRLPDAGGRRVEAVVAVVHTPDDEAAHAHAAAAIAATARAGVVPAPASAPPPPDWITFRIAGAAEEQDAVLYEAVAPLVGEARARRAIAGWFFIRYLDAAGQPHLRVRLRGRAGRAPSAALARRLARLLGPLRARGAVVALETAEYFPEAARYGGPAPLAAAERLFEAGSDLALAMLHAESAAADDEGAAGPAPGAQDRRLVFARAAEALARGLGLAPEARAELAERRRRALAVARGGEPPAWLAEVRRLGRTLQAALAGARLPDRPRAADLLGPALAELERAARRERAALSAADAAALVAAVPALLHTQAVRLLGTDAADEHAGYLFWARALAGVIARGLAG
jgi:thiopeptide-type bacteriocin biosynthesis protein